MILTLTWLVASILGVLSAVHLYWVLGGIRGITIAVPSSGEAPIFRPSKPATMLVMLLLAAAAWFVIELAGIARVVYPAFLLNVGGWLLAAVFILRAVGDFKWMGWFKRNKGSAFARWDSLVYSPLCFFLGLALILIALYR